MSILLGVIVLFMLLTLAVAVMQGMAVVRLAPASENLAGFMPLGWWKFRQLEQKAGPAAAEPLNIYKRAVVAFMVFLALGLVLSGWAANQAQAARTAALVNDWRIIPAADFALDSRRAAPVPGDHEILES